MTNHQPAPTALICENEGKRIPLSLQAVFLNGNRGKEIHTPPPDASAMKEFSRSNARGSGRWRPFRTWSSRTAADARRKSAVEVAAPVQVEMTEKLAPVRKVRRTKVSNEIVMDVDVEMKCMWHQSNLMCSCFFLTFVEYTRTLVIPARLFRRFVAFTRLLHNKIFNLAVCIL